MIYVDNAATTKLSKRALDEMMPYLTENYGNASSLYAFGQKSKEAIENARSVVASFIGANPSEIYFTSGGTEADNQAINSSAYFGALKNKKHIISSKFEHHAVLHTLKKLEREGFEVTYLDVHENGIVRVEELKKAIREDTCLCTIMFANNEIGTIQPIKEIGEVCRERGVIFHTDAVQAVGHIEVNVQTQNIDMLSISAHKFHGPKGVGVLYCKQNVPLRSFLEGGAQERKKRAGTENVAGIVGMAAALKEVMINRETAAKHQTMLRDRLIDGLLKIPHTKLNGDRTNRLPNNVNVSFEGIEGESLILLLDDDGICVSSGSACTSGSLEPSHVLLAIGLPHEIAHGSLRITLDASNTLDDVDYILKKVPEVVSYLRNMSPLWEELELGKKEFQIK